jgi:hypothetical protein
MVFSVRRRMFAVDICTVLIIEVGASVNICSANIDQT